MLATNDKVPLHAWFYGNGDYTFNQWTRWMHHRADRQRGDGTGHSLTRLTRYVRSLPAFRLPAAAHRRWPEWHGRHFASSIDAGCH